MQIERTPAQSCGEKFAFVNATVSGNTTVVAAVAGKRIKVLTYSVGPASAAVNVYFNSSTAGAISGTKNLAINGGCFGEPHDMGFFQTAAGEALQINLSTNANVGVDVTYVLV